MVHGRHLAMLHRRMAHSLRLAMVHLRVIHAGVAFVPIGGNRFGRLRCGPTRSLRHRMAHSAVACGLHFAFSLGRCLCGRHRVTRMVLCDGGSGGSEEHTSELQSLMRISYAVFCLKKKIQFLPRFASNTPLTEIHSSLTITPVTNSLLV